MAYFLKKTSFSFLFLADEKKNQQHGGIPCTTFEVILRGCLSEMTSSMMDQFEFLKKKVHKWWWNGSTNCLYNEDDQCFGKNNMDASSFLEKCCTDVLVFKQMGDDDDVIIHRVFGCERGVNSLLKMINCMDANACDDTEQIQKRYFYSHMCLVSRLLNDCY